jgi:dipeptidyl aminopeptidase/acylaminoacyl peptidase
VADPLAKSFSVAHLIEPEKRSVKSFDGLNIPYFLFSPESRNEGTTFLQSRTKHPAVIFLPPPTWQVQKQFDAQSQFLANIGYFFVAINYRGCDGYGKKYAGMQNVEDQAKDVLAVYHELLQNPSVDSDNIFILTSSAGQDVATEVLATAPQLWSGVALDKPANCYVDERYNPKNLPPFLLIMGDQDDGFEAMKKFESWARGQGVAVESLIHMNSGHITYKSSERKSTLDHIAKFFSNHIK